MRVEKLSQPATGNPSPAAAPSYPLDPAEDLDKEIAEAIRKARAERAAAALFLAEA